MTAAHEPETAGHVPTVLALVGRERARDLLKRTLPRKRARLHLARTAAEFELAFRREIIDAAIVDLALPTEDSWHGARLARDFPSVPFFALTPCRIRLWTG